MCEWEGRFERLNCLLRPIKIHVSYLNMVHFYFNPVIARYFYQWTSSRYSRINRRKRDFFPIKCISERIIACFKKLIDSIGCYQVTSEIQIQSTHPRILLVPIILKDVEIAKIRRQFQKTITRDRSINFGKLIIFQNYQDMQNSRVS